MTPERGDCTEPDYEGTRLAEILGSRAEPLIMPADEFAALRTVAVAAGMASPSPVPSGGAATATGPAGAVRERLEAALDASIDGCARCKVCDTQIGAAMTVLGPLLERAEAAEAKLARVEELARQLTTATHPTIGGTFAASIGHKFLAVISSEEEPRDA